MAGIRGSKTSPEMKIRRLLHRHGFRYSVRKSAHPRRSDTVLTI
ncbi:hypothetical protein [Pseudomonas sp.]